MTLKVIALSYERDYLSLFENLHFQLLPGEGLLIEGPNGSGKTTLLRILAGLNEPTSGRVTWDQRSVFSDPELFHSQLAYLGHQNGLKLHLTVIENIKLMCALNQVSIQASMIDSLLNSLKLSTLKNKKAKQLSMGQQRRLSYLRLLLRHKKLWLIDEPTTGIDQEGQRLFVELLQTHLEKKGIAILSTHHTLPILYPMKKLQLGQLHE